MVVVVTLVSPVRFQDSERLYGEGNGRHEGLSFVAGLYGGVRVRHQSSYVRTEVTDVLTWCAVVRFASLLITGSMSRMEGYVDTR